MLRSCAGITSLQLCYFTLIMAGKRREFGDTLVADLYRRERERWPFPVSFPDDLVHQRNKRAKSGKSKSIGGGWVSFRANTLSQFPAGPRNIEEVFDWPTSTVDSIIKLAEWRNRGVVLDNLEKHMQYGVDIVTDYSGMDCPRWSLEPVEKALRRSSIRFASKRRFGHGLGCSIKFHRSCDKGRLQKQVLKSLAENLDDSTTCVFEDLLDRLPKAAQKCLIKMMPSDKATIEEKRLAYSDIRSWLHDNRKWIATVTYVLPTVTYALAYSDIRSWLATVHRQKQHKIKKQ